MTDSRKGRSRAIESLARVLLAVRIIHKTPLPEGPFEYHVPSYYFPSTRRVGHELDMLLAYATATIVDEAGDRAQAYMLGAEGVRRNLTNEEALSICRSHMDNRPHEIDLELFGEK